MRIVPVSLMIFVRNITDTSLELWTQKRWEKGDLYGLQEFPGGKIEDGETSKQAIVREVHEEVGTLIPDTYPVLLFKIDSIQKNAELTLKFFIHFSPYNDIDHGQGEWLTITKEKLSGPFGGTIPPMNHGFIDQFALYLWEQKKNGNLEDLWTISFK